MMDVRAEGKKLLAGIGYILLLLWFIRHYQLDFIQIFFVLLGARVAMLMYAQKFNIKELFKSIVILLIIMGVLRWLGKYGVIGFILSTVAITIWILSSRWKQYIKVKQHIETLIWGQPLKDYKEEGERPPKVKVVWGKKE